MIPLSSLVILNSSLLKWRKQLYRVREAWRLRSSKLLLLQLLILDGPLVAVVAPYEQLAVLTLQTQPYCSCLSRRCQRSLGRGDRPLASAGSVCQQWEDTSPACRMQ